MTAKKRRPFNSALYVMTNRAEFTAATKRALAKRAGNMCSFPGCKAPTEGPSEEGKSSVSNTGMACHIVAAANGPAARRVEPNWTKNQLFDLSNGIWMCYTHGKLIDTDEATYTVPMLRAWRHFSELRARLSQETGILVELDPSHLGAYPMPECQLEIAALGNENTLIGEVIVGSCMPQLWGRPISAAVRDALIELTRNAFQHGGASSVTVEILPKSVRLIDDGAPFDSLKLRTNENSGGGSLSVDILLKTFGLSLYYVSSREDGKNVNEVSYVRSQSDIRDLTPCTIDITLDELREEGQPIVVSQVCDRVFIMFPEYFALSDTLRMPKLVSERLPSGKEYVFVGRCLSEGVVELLSKSIPSVRVINFEA